MIRVMMRTALSLRKLDIEETRRNISSERVITAMVAMATMFVENSGFVPRRITRLIEPGPANIGIPNGTREKSTGVS